MKKRRIRLTALFLAALVAASSTTVYAAEGKQEIVYAMADASGSVTGIYVVNLWPGGDIVDYGDYSEVRNMTTDDEVTYSGGEVRVTTDADQIYYQGTLENAELPWDISIHYYMDGTEYEPDEIAGKSGALEIRISVRENKACEKSSFWKGYALQAALTLDGEKCLNIEAENATIANVGANKQLSYIILPGKEKDFTIRADARDFSMDEISINGVRLNLEIELDDSELKDRVQELKDAVEELNDGAGELNDGAEDLNDGAGELNDGAGDLDDGVRELNDGIEKMQDALKELDATSPQLNNGSAQVLSALETIQSSLESVSLTSADLSALVEASAQIQAGIDSLVQGLSSVDGGIDSYYASLRQAGLSSAEELAAMNQQAGQSLGITTTMRSLYAAYATGGNDALTAKLTELAKAGDKEAVELAAAVSAGNTGALTDYVKNAGTLITLESLLNANNSYIEGSDALISGIDDTLDATDGELMTGALTLQAKYKEFDQNIQALAEGLGGLAESMTSLKLGIDELVKSYRTLDKGLGDYTGAVAEIVVAYEKLYEGALDLEDGTGELMDGVEELKDGTGELCDGTRELLDGTNEFSDETEGLDDEISDTIDDTIDEMTGKNVETVSFVSDKNTDIASVQFVIKTAAIELPEEEEAEEAREESLNFWQKFLKLFGWEG